MIVNCPNCSLEQPLDPFCAGCGKQLPKLIAEQKLKAKKRNRSSQKIIMGSVAFFCLGFYAYYAYQNPSARPFAQNSEDSKIKLTMSKSTIKASKYQQKDFSKPLKVKGFALSAAGQSPEPEVKPEPATKPTKPEPKKTTVNVREVYLINVEGCTNGEIEAGPLSTDELAFFIDCSKVLLKLRSGETMEIDANLPFANAVSFSLKNKSLSLDIELSFEEPAFKTTQTFRFSQSPIRSAGYISLVSKNRRVSAYISEKLPLAQKEVLESDAASTLLGLSSDETPSPKGYFLAVYD